MSRIHVAPILLAIAFGWGPAGAGIADSPLPKLAPGEKTFHLYSVPGVIQQSGLSTYFSCTSVDTAPMRVGVEVFSYTGGSPKNDPTATSPTGAPAGSRNVAPGATVLFGTSSPSWTVMDSVLNVGVVPRGSARILATSKKLLCTAFLADPGKSAFPSGLGVSLPIIKCSPSEHCRPHTTAIPVTRP